LLRCNRFLNRLDNRLFRKHTYEYYHNIIFIALGKVRNQVKRYVFEGLARYLVRLKESIGLVSRSLVTLVGNTVAYVVLYCPLHVRPPKRSGHYC
jgi:hypothetical protein